MSMKVEYINPFIESVHELFSTMLDARAERGTIAVFNGERGSRDITALIGLSGTARGTVALAFPTATALAMVSKLLGEPHLVVDATVSDGVAELVNMVAGNAKAKLSGQSNIPIDLSLPTVVRGNSYDVDYPRKTTWLEVPFSSELGPFSLRVTIQLEQQTNGGAK